MSIGLYTHTTRATGTILTAAIYNADHQNHITNQNPEMTGGLSDTLGEHQSMSDPGGVGTEVLAASLADELLQLRFCIDRIVGGAQWYSTPAVDLNTMAGNFQDLTVMQTATFRGDLSPAQITANQNNYNPTGLGDAFRIRLNSDASRDITGIVEGSGFTGRMLEIVNVGSFDITLKNEDAASSAGNRFLFGANLVLRPGRSILLQYDQTSVPGRWRTTNSALLADTALDGFPVVTSAVDFDEIAPPANPTANRARLYAKDVSSVTKLAYRDSAGTEQILEAPSQGQGIESIASGSLSGATVSIINIPSKYSYIHLEIRGGSHDAGAARIPLVQPSVNNGSSYDGTVGNFTGYAFNTNGDIVAEHAQATLGANQAIVAATTFNLDIMIFSYHGGPFKRVSYRYTDSVGIDSYYGTLWYVGNEVDNIDALQILLSGTGNFDAGTYALWGIY